MMWVAELDVHLHELIQRHLSAAMKLQVDAHADVEQARHERGGPSAKTGASALARQFRVETNDQ